MVKQENILNDMDNFYQKIYAMKNDNNKRITISKITL